MDYVTFSFEPIQEIDLKHLTLKVYFLVAITSAKRVRDNQALGAEDPIWFSSMIASCLELYQDSDPKCRLCRILISRLSYLLSTPIPLQMKRKTQLDVGRALLSYLECNNSFYKTDHLFLSF